MYKRMAYIHRPKGWWIHFADPPLAIEVQLLREHLVIWAWGVTITNLHSAAHPNFFRRVKIVGNNFSTLTWGWPPPIDLKAFLSQHSRWHLMLSVLKTWMWSWMAASGLAMPSWAPWRPFIWWELCLEKKLVEGKLSYIFLICINALVSYYH